MSHYTHVQLYLLDYNEFELSEADLNEIVREHMISEDVVQDITELLTKGEASLSVWCEDVIGIFSRIATRNPGVQFVIRGFGEEPRDVFVREFSEGQVVFSLGPPSDAVEAPS